MQDLELRFTYHPPTAATIPMHEQVREECLIVAGNWDELLPDCREKSLAITHLEEAMMWANAAIARHVSAGPPA